MSFNAALAFNIKLNHFYFIQHPFHNLNETHSVGNSILSVNEKFRDRPGLSTGGRTSTDVLRILNTRQVTVCPAFYAGLKEGNFFKKIVKFAGNRFLLDLDNLNITGSFYKVSFESSSEEIFFSIALKEARGFLNSTMRLKAAKSEQYFIYKRYSSLLRGAFLNTSLDGKLEYTPETYDC